MTQFQNTDFEDDAPVSLPPVEPVHSRPVLVAYPISYARRDASGRLVLDPSRLPAPEAAAETAAVAPRRTWTMALLLLIGGGVILVDQLTKRLIEARLPLYSESTPIDWLYPYFRFTHTANYGAAFGMFQSGGLIFGVIAALVSAAILVYNYQLPPGERLLRVALGLQMGGALGNLIDRLRQGYVTDFFDVDVSTIVNIPYISDWPIFNIADFSIVSGVVILAVMMLFHREEPVPGADAVQDEDEALPAGVTIVGEEPLSPSVTIVEETPAWRGTSADGVYGP